MSWHPIILFNVAYLITPSNITRDMYDFTFGSKNLSIFSIENKPTKYAINNEILNSNLNNQLINFNEKYPIIEYFNSFSICI